MSITYATPAEGPSRVELEAAYRRAQQDENTAARRLVDAGFGDEAYAEFMAAAETTIMLRGQLHAGGTWTQDGGLALLTDWCHCTVKTESTLYQRFSPEGRPVTHGVVCGRCRHVTQVG